jgi:hypothetical protein
VVMGVEVPKYAADESRSDVHAGGVLFEWKGEEITITPRTLGMEKAFETFARQRAWDAVERDRSFLGERRYNDMMDGVRRDITAGLYAWGMPLCVATLQTPDGAMRMAWIQIKEAHPDFPMEEVREIFEDSENEYVMEGPDKPVLGEDGKPIVRRQCKLEELILKLREANTFPNRNRAKVAPDKR